MRRQATRIVGGAVAAFLAPVLPILVAPTAAGGSVAITATVLSDDGDDDGFADTNETVSLQIEVRNATGTPLGGVSARLEALDPQLACVTEPLVEIGDLALGESRLVGQPFVVVVGPIDRSDLGLSALDQLVARFEITIESASGPHAVSPSTLVLDLDLDAEGGAGPATFLESFEGELGAFGLQNLDQGRHGMEASDGFRCQYSDPQSPYSNTYGTIHAPTCYLGVSLEHADAIYWKLSGPGFSPEGGRGFSGFHSLFFGIDLGFPLNWTYPLAVLEAAVTTEPVNLGWDGATPTLSYMQQVSLVDSRTIAMPDGEAADRGIVMLQLADENGEPHGPWIKLHPHQNVYDQRTTEKFVKCMFDPVDDGTTEDDYFDPDEPAPRFGPSSTCYPEYAFVHLGDTDAPFGSGSGPDALGNAEGPGHQGLWGIGTWVESRFDLGRFRGRRVRLRFLATSMKFLGKSDWENYRPTNPQPGDDGWWIDDVTISGTLDTPATVTADTKDNSLLPALDATDDGDLDAVCDAGDNCPLVANADQSDGDGDGAGLACDCADSEDSTYPGAPEINDGLDNQCPGDPGHGVADETTGNSGFHDPDDPNEYSWPPQPGATRYRVVRSYSPAFYGGCTFFTVKDPRLVDPALPHAGEVLYYLNRPMHPNVGSWGQDSAGNERTLACAN